MSELENLKKQILELTAKYQSTRAALENKPQQKSENLRVPYAGRIFDEDEVQMAVESSLEFWLTSGRHTQAFESEFAKYMGLKFALLTNSGSSSNLLAFSALTSPILKDRRIERGDEVITVAAGFPTTVAPILQYGAVPVFLDVTIPQYNIDVSQLEAAKSSRTKAVMVAHTLGNPFDLKAVKEFCDKHKLWLIEDNCDALGATYNLDGTEKLTGSFGDIATSSFYPAHHITMGEGGAVYTNSPHLNKILASFRDWGRDCWCPSGKDNTCQKRFNWSMGQLPKGYDHKYIYSHFGYNLKATDIQAAIGCAQLKKIDRFVEARRTNWNLLREGLSGLQEHMILPEAAPNSNPSWFGFLATMRQPGERTKIVQFLEKRGIQTRPLFSGNLLRHPCFDSIRKDEGKAYRKIGDLPNTDRIMENSFWFGVYPGLTPLQIEHLIESCHAYFKA